MGSSSKSLVCPAMLVFVLALLLLVPNVSVAADASSISEAVARLDKSQEQFIKDELTGQLPNLFSSKADREIASQFISEIRTFGTHIGEIRDGNYMGLVNTVAKRGADWVQDKIEQRYPDPNSPVRRVMQSVKDYPDLYKKMSQAALNPDKGDFAQTSAEVMTEYGRRKLDSLQAEGVSKLKDTARGIIRAPGILSEVGLDPVDLYIQGVSSMSDFMQRTGGRFHRGVFDCYYERYRESAATSSPDTTSDELKLLGLKGHKCGDRATQESIGAWVTNAAKSLMTDSSTLGEFDLTRDELFDLLKEYHKQRKAGSAPGFSGWLEDRFDEGLKNRKKQARDKVIANQNSETASDGEDWKAVAVKVEAALVAALGRLPKDQPAPDSPPGRGGIPTADGDGTKDKAKDGKTVASAEPAAATPDPCDAVQKDITNAKILAGNGNLAAAQGKLDSIAAGACPKLGPQIEAVRGDVASSVDGLVAQAGTAIGSCDAAAVDAARSKLGATVHGRLNEARDRMQAVSTALSGINAAYAEGKRAYEAGDMQAARGALERARQGIVALGGNPDCPVIASRIDEGLGKIGRIGEKLDKVANAISNCNAAALGVYRDQLAGAGALHPSLAGKLAELNRIVPAIERANSHYNEAKEVYSSGDYSAARSKLGAARGAIIELNGNPSCSGLTKRIEAGMSKIARIEAAIAQADAAIGNCRREDIKRLIAKFSAIRDANVRLIRKTEELREAEKDCERRNVAKANEWCKSNKGGGYYAKRQANGRYICYPTKAAANDWCQRKYNGSGWSATAIKDDGSYRCRQSSEGRTADANADCRSSEGVGYYASFLKDGRYHCVPSQAAANNWCRNKYTGSGWSAVGIKRDGSFSCSQSGQGQRADAVADCRRQHGNNLLRVYYSKGQWYCEYGKKTTGAPTRPAAPNIDLGGIARELGKTTTIYRRR